MRSPPPRGKVTLEFLDSRGTVLRTYSSDAPAADTLKTAADSIGAGVRAALRDSVVYWPADSVVSARAGAQQFVWDMRYPGAKQLKNTVVDEGTLAGPVIPPGRYGVRLIVDADTLARTFDVVADPRATSTTAELVAQAQASLRVRDRITDLVDAATRIEEIQAQLDQRSAQAKSIADSKQITDRAAALRKQLEEIRAALYEVGCHVDQCTLDQPIKLYNMLITLNWQLQTGDYPPTKQHGEVAADLGGKLDRELRRLQQIEEAELKAMNEMLKAAGLPPVFVPKKAGIA